MGLTLGIPLLALAAVLHASLLALLFPLGGAPNLLYLLVVAWAVNADLRSSILWAMIGGVLLDLLSALPLGTSALGLVMVVAVIKALNRRARRAGILLIALFTLGASPFFEVYRIVIVDILEATGLLPTDTGFTPSWVTDFTTAVLPTLVYNALLVWFVVLFLWRIQQRMPVTES